MTVRETMTRENIIDESETAELRQRRRREKKENKKLVSKRKQCRKHC